MGHTYAYLSLHFVDADLICQPHNQTCVGTPPNDYAYKQRPIVIFDATLICQVDFPEIVGFNSKLV